MHQNINSFVILLIVKMQNPKAYRLRITRPQQSLLTFTQQPLQFHLQFSVSLTFSQSHAILTPSPSTLPLPFKHCCSLLHHLCSLQIRQCRYTPKQANEVQNEYYRGLSDPRMRRLVEKFKAVVVPRTAIREIVGEVDAKLKYYFVVRDRERGKEFASELERLQVLRDRDEGNRELDRARVAGKEELTIALKRVVCLRMLGVRGFAEMDGIVVRRGVVYCDKPVDVNELLNASEEYVIEEGELPYKGFLKLISDPKILQKMDLQKSRVFHQIQFINQINRYSYYRAVRQDKIYYVRHVSCPPLSEILSYLGWVLQKSVKYLSLELGELEGIKINSYVEQQITKYLPRESINSITIKNDLLSVNYASTTNINGKILALLVRLRKVYKIPISESVKNVFVQRSYYKSWMDRLANQSNILWKIITPLDSPSTSYLALRGISDSPNPILTQISNLISKFSIFTFRIFTDQLPTELISIIASKFNELAEQLPLKNPIINTKPTQIEISGVVLEQHQAEDIVKSIEMCLAEMGVEEGVIEERADFEGEEVGLEEEMTRSQIDQEEEEEGRELEQNVSMSQMSRTQKSLNMIQRSLDISAVQNKGSAQHSMVSDLAIQQLIFRHEVIIPHPLLQDLDLNQLSKKFTIQEADDQFIVLAKTNDDIQRLTEVLESSVMNSKLEGNVEAILKKKEVELRRKFEGLRFIPQVSNYKDRKWAWKLMLVSLLKISNIEVFEGFFAGDESIRRSEIPQYKKQLITYGPAGDANGIIEHFQQFIVEQT